MIAHHTPAVFAPRSRLESPGRRPRRAAFTLVEIMVAMTILGLGMTITMVVFLAAVKRANHTETMLKGTSELRYAADMISQTVRSASEPPTTTDGTDLYVAPGSQGYLLVDEITFIDSAKTTKGTKAGMKVMQVDPYRSAATYSQFSGSSRPSGALAAGDVGTYFIASGNAPAPTVSSLVSVNDTLSVPQTSYGPAQTLTVNSVSKNSGTSTITCSTALAYSVPQGTKISIISGHRPEFAVINGQLRYFPDSSVQATYAVLAYDISSTPLSDPANAAGAITKPFVISGTNPSFVTINLQMIPKGTTAGRTLQGVETTAYARTNPATP